MKPTKKWIKEQMADEKKSARMYRKRGFHNIAKDESKHLRILRKALKKMV